MSKKQDLERLLSRQHEMVSKALDEVTEQESTYQPTECINHIRWLAGHIAYGAGLVLKHLGSEGELPENWEEMFGKGSVLKEESQVYPSFGEIRNQIYSMYDKQLELVNQMDAEDFSKSLDSTGEDGDSPLRSIQFLCSHEFYHLGQIMVIRHMQGGNRIFG